MKSRFLFRTASSLFLLAAIACGFIALRPLENGVRIPVHGGNATMGYIDDRGSMVIDKNWRTATPFGSNDRAQVSATSNPSKIKVFFGRWIPALRQSVWPRTDEYSIDRFGNTTPKIPDPLSFPDWTAELPAEINLIKRVKFSWILKDGSPAFPGGWQNALDFKADDPAAVYENGRWGFIDRKGKPVLPFQWDETLGFDGNGRACVAINRKWGVIDTTGQLVVPLYFQSLGGYDDQGMCAAQLASGCGFIDSQGKIRIPFRYQKAGNFDRFEMAKIHIIDMHGKTRCGWIGRGGEALVPPIYDVEQPIWGSAFADHELLPVIDAKGPHLIDRTGRTVVGTARGELQLLTDPMAPGKFWIGTSPHRSATPPPGEHRPPFEPACYDQTGNLIWNDGILASRKIPVIAAITFGLVSALSFATSRRSRRLKTAV